MGYSMEELWGDTSNEYPQHMFYGEIRKMFLFDCKKKHPIWKYGIYFCLGLMKGCVQKTVIVQDAETVIPGFESQLCHINFLRLIIYRIPFFIAFRSRDLGLNPAMEAEFS